MAAYPMSVGKGAAQVHGDQPPREAWIVFPSDTHHRGSRNVWVLAVIYEIISLAIMKPARLCCENDFRENSLKQG